jgi:hypothetical protein
MYIYMYKYICQIYFFIWRIYRYHMHMRVIERNINLWQEHIINDNICLGYHSRVDMILVLFHRWPFGNGSVMKSYFIMCHYELPSDVISILYSKHILWGIVKKAHGIFLGHIFLMCYILMRYFKIRIS